MTWLVLGLVVFFSAHSVRIVADGWRARQIEHLGELAWKGLYSLVSAIGITLIVWGYGLTRTDPIAIWDPPMWTRHVAALLTLPAFILITAANLPGTHIKAKLHHRCYWV